MLEVFLGFWLLCALVAAVVANSKGRSGCGWLILSIIFGPLALLGVAVASVDPQKAKERETKAGLQSGALRRCPSCAEPIRREAMRCPHCSTDVEPLPPTVGLVGKLMRR